MVVNMALKAIGPFIPVAGSPYGFGKTCIRVYSATSPSKAIIAGVKGIIIDCTTPMVKYPLLCAGALACGGAACVTGDPSFMAGAFECLAGIVEG
jgi:hypothetical protein